jgi:hypothetical protein
LLRVASIVALALLATAQPAAARDVIAEVVTGERLGQVLGRGAAGLYVPGDGLYVSRQEALERLGQLPNEPCRQLARCRYEVFVSVPPLAAQENDQRYQVAILGGDFEGILVSDNTRIPGLVSIDDIRETVEALDEGRDPPVHWQRVDRPVVELQRLDRRLDDARDAQGPASMGLAFTLIALVAGAIAIRSRTLARAALVYPFAALALALLGAELDRVGPRVTTVLVVLAAPLALLLGRLAPLSLSVPLALGAYGLVLALAPETNALMAIGPHPWSGGRFYGVTNQIETLILAPTLAAAVALGGWRLVGLGALSLLVVGASATGADGGGLIVFATAFVVLWLLQHDRASSLPWGVAAVVALGLAFVGLDALLGGSSHVVDTVADGPGELLDTFGERVERSVSIVTSTVWQLAAFAGGMGVLAYFAAQRPRFAVVDAFLIAIAVSLVVNDSPTKVAAYGAVMCGALRAWAVSHDAPGIESRA